jgi:hypothetical protein
MVHTPIRFQVVESLLSQRTLTLQLGQGLPSSSASVPWVNSISESPPER